MTDQRRFGSPGVYVAVIMGQADKYIPLQPQTYRAGKYVHGGEEAG